MTRHVEPPIPLPNWPALLDEDLAAAYLHMSPESFRAVTAQNKVAPVDMGLRLLRWRRRDLDALVDRLPARGAKLNPDAPIRDPAKAGLEKVRRRAKA